MSEWIFFDILIVKVREERETPENQKRAALEAIKRLGYILAKHQYRNSEKGLLLESIKELKNTFFPDKTWQEIFSYKEKDKNQSPQT